MTPEALTGGFTNAATDAAIAFRAALEAMARPGTLHRMAGVTPPAPLSPAAGALLLTLTDTTTPVHLAGAVDCPAVRDWITFHTGAPFAPADQADFAVGGWAALQPLTRFRIGQPDYPDRSTTLIVELPALSTTGATLRGPGIRDTAQLSLPEIAAFRANRALFPLGFDCYFTSGDTLAALPRSTLVEEA
ncbi:MAG: phosphonate C-P lyase system protein PhnH [Rhodobacterales bacterium 65-51]|uniref:phosphonate C-P lyase system protein PhnH n=1 Tax=uncultured Gemmobacter sp. TaxID=1095917 RepID=UPI0009620EB2|nr:phosphonate C-P lyase system protein PhnH [uncultured Gemmobacter sp.]OJY32327.1 MAG: phosphonate C-P lyase system protein PhnH [Rhodobacterales bacterium 65-51]